jgi:hypothetical protein
VKKRLEAMIGSPAYRVVLSGWIAEAAMGLSGSEIEVTTSAKSSPHRRGPLREAEKREGCIGKTVTSQE